MAEKTEIAWTDSTFNPWWGCSRVGPGCDHCYAEALDRRTGEIWCTDAGAAIMPVWGGELCEAGPALDGWISCWQRIVDGERLDIDLQPLRTLHAKLDQGEMLTLDLVDHCRQVTYACRRAYGRMPRARAKSYSLTELIAVEVEECGLAGDAAGESGAAR